MNNGRDLSEEFVKERLTAFKLRAFALSAAPMRLDIHDLISGHAEMQAVARSASREKDVRGVCCHVDGRLKFSGSLAAPLKRAARTLVACGPDEVFSNSMRTSEKICREGGVEGLGVALHERALGGD